MTKKKQLSWEEKQIEEERRRKQVEVTVDCDWDRMTGDIDGMIRYLEEIRDQYRGKGIRFNVESQGYDGFDMEFFYMREEDDQEYQRRMEILNYDIGRKAEQRRKDEERMKIAAEIERLQSKLKKIY